MPFIGNQPALSYTSFAKQDFTTSATTSYTLDHPVTNENEIALFINFVRQEPTTAYTASNTSLTLTSATSASDDMYCVFLGKAVQTVNPPAGSVGASQIATGVLPTNTPAWSVKFGSNLSIAENVETVIAYNTVVIDTDSGFNTSTYKYTVPSGKAGKYFVVGQINTNLLSLTAHQNIIRVNGSDVGIKNLFQSNNTSATEVFTNSNYIGSCVSGIVDLSEGDEVTHIVFAAQNGTSNLTLFAADSVPTRFYGYKLIG